MNIAIEFAAIRTRLAELPNVPAWTPPAIDAFANGLATLAALDTTEPKLHRLGAIVATTLLWELEEVNRLLCDVDPALAIDKALVEPLITRFANAAPVGPIATIACARCGALAARFDEKTARTGVDILVYHGIVEPPLERTELGLAALALCDAIARGELAAADAIMVLDCYCPTCDRAACSACARGEAEDQGGYAMADTRWFVTCPAGHRREVFHFYSLT